MSNIAAKTYLQLCQDTARDSGTVTGTKPVSVLNQTGRELKVVNFVREAWVQIQNERNDWRWMRKEFSGALIAEAPAYTYASFSITDFGSWVEEKDLIINLPAIGRADDSKVAWLPFEDWKAQYDFGGQTSNRPQHWTVRPYDGALLLGPTPAVIYNIRGPYRRATQEMTADADTPDMPAQFHNGVKWKALVLLNSGDEAALPVAYCQDQLTIYTDKLEKAQLDGIDVGATLA